MDLDTALDIIYEQFNPSLIISKVKGEMNVEWSNCSEDRCADEEKIDMQICKSSCVISAASTAISKLSAARSECSKSKTPTTCLDRILRAVEMMRSKIIREREKRVKAIDRRAKYRASLGRGA
jgi:hypothetical protein